MRALDPGFDDVEPHRIGGEAADARSGNTLDVFDPATGAVIAKVPAGGAEDVDAAVSRHLAAGAASSAKPEPTPVPEPEPAAAPPPALEPEPETIPAASAPAATESHPEPAPRKGGLFHRIKR